VYHQDDKLVKFPHLK